jgi:hypothetical protein
MLIYILLVDKFIAILNILLDLFYLDYLVIYVSFKKITMFQINFTNGYEFFSMTISFMFESLSFSVRYMTLILIVFRFRFRYPLSVCNNLSFTDMLSIFDVNSFLNNFTLDS